MAEPVEAAFDKLGQQHKQKRPFPAGFDRLNQQETAVSIFQQSKF